MAKLRFWIPAITAVASLLSAQVPAQGGSPTDAAVAKVARPAITIATVDLDEAIDRYGVAVKERERLKKLSERFSDELNKITKGLEELQGQMSLLKPGSHEYDQSEFELRSAMNHREGLAKLRKRQFDNGLRKFELEVYADLEYAIARVAKDRGIAIVLRSQRTLRRDPSTSADDVGFEQARLGQFNRRTVWYAEAEVDITAHLINYLQVFDVRAERKKAAADAAAKSAAGKPAGGKPTPAKASTGNPKKDEPKGGESKRSESHKGI